MRSYTRLALLPVLSTAIAKPLFVQRAAVAAPPACTLLFNFFSFCDNAIPGFENLPAPSKVNCLCSSGTAFVPDPFDNAVETCGSFAVTADTRVYASLQLYNTFCHAQGPSQPIITPVPNGGE